MTNSDAFLDEEFNEIKCVRCEMSDLTSIQKIENDYFCVDCLSSEIITESVEELD